MQKPSIVWAMPETRGGFIPTAGASPSGRQPDAAHVALLPILFQMALVMRRLSLGGKQAGKGLVLVFDLPIYLPKGKEAGKVSNPQIIVFEEALRESDAEIRHLLLGNGFSIALFPTRFHYDSLLETANFTGITEARRAFDELKTTNFEEVIKALKQAAALLSLYSQNEADVSEKMGKHIHALKETLVQAIAGRHPELRSDVSDAQCLSCQSFLARFNGNFYTMNYDLLLYWVILRFGFCKEKRIEDGFRPPNGDGNAKYVTWDGGAASQTQRLYFLHGALHFFDHELELRKLCWERAGSVPLIEQIRKALDADEFPLYVAEGNSDKKFSQIRHNVYLYDAFSSFSEIEGSLFIYGHSLASSDEHILRKIETGKTKRLYISFYGDLRSPDNKLIIERANKISAARDLYHPLSVSFFDATEANVWGNCSQQEEALSLSF